MFRSKERKGQITSPIDQNVVIRKNPVASADEWFEREGLENWPLQLASEGELDLSSIAQILQTNEELLQDLKKHAPLEINVLDNLLEEVVALEGKLNGFAKHVLVSPQETEKDEYQGHEDDATDDNISAKSAASWKTGKQDCFISSRQRSIEHTAFPGFDPFELTALPGSLEAPQLLNRVTGLQQFSGDFKRIWKKHFLSEASVAIFQDIFWWWFLDRFQPDSEGQACLFDRVADSFVGLFLSIPADEKDKFFQMFADCLAQSVYAAFCESFPMSFKSFDDSFRSDLLNLVSEWTVGTNPPPNTWKKWDLNLLETEQIKSLQEDRTHQLKSSLSFDPDTFLKSDQSELNIDAQVTFINASISKFKRPPNESHQAGPGPEFERVLFHLHGKSPLIAHFLAANRLQFQEPASVKKYVTRTEIAKLPSPFPTYQELIHERKRIARIANRRYTETMEDSAEERRLIGPQSGKHVVNADRLRGELPPRQNETELSRARNDVTMTNADREITADSTFQESSIIISTNSDEE